MLLCLFAVGILDPVRTVVPVEDDGDCYFVDNGYDVEAFVLDNVLRKGNSNSSSSISFSTITSTPSTIQTITTTNSIVVKEEKEQPVSQKRSKRRRDSNEKRKSKRINLNNGASPSPRAEALTPVLSPPNPTEEASYSTALTTVATPPLILTITTQTPIETTLLATNSPSAQLLPSSESVLLGELALLQRKIMEIAEMLEVEKTERGKLQQIVNR